MSEGADVLKWTKELDSNTPAHGLTDKDGAWILTGCLTLLVGLALGLPDNGFFVLAVWMGTFTGFCWLEVAYKTWRASRVTRRR